jgi:MoaA/NifB/PqqE/SkfB family radical SAM enzyme
MQKKEIERYTLLPRRMSIENTNICTANCLFCPHDQMKREKGVMDRKLSEQIIDLCMRYKIHCVSMHGFGEPLLDKYFYDRIRYAKEKGIERVTTNTNAGFLNKKNAQKLLESGIDEIYISFDAAQEGTYRTIRPGLKFAQVEENIRYLVELKRRARKKLFIALSYVECETNKKETREYIDKWQKVVDCISITPMRNWPEAPMYRAPDEKIFRKDPCRLIWTDMRVSWNGEVPLCCNDYDGKVILGDITRQDIKEIWAGSPLKAIRDLHIQGRFDEIPLCAPCEYNYHRRAQWWVFK